MQQRHRGLTLQETHILALCQTSYTRKHGINRRKIASELGLAPHAVIAMAAQLQRRNFIRPTRHVRTMQSAHDKTFYGITPEGTQALQAELVRLLPAMKSVQRRIGTQPEKIVTGSLRKGLLNPKRLLILAHLSAAPRPLISPEIQQATKEIVKTRDLEAMRNDGLLVAGASRGTFIISATGLRILRNRCHQLLPAFERVDRSLRLGVPDTVNAGQPDKNPSFATFETLLAVQAIGALSIRDASDAFDWPMKAATARFERLGDLGLARCAGTDHLDSAWVPTLRGSRLVQCEVASLLPMFQLVVDDGTIEPRVGVHMGIRELPRWMSINTIKTLVALRAYGPQTAGALVTRVPSMSKTQANDALSACERNELIRHNWGVSGYELTSKGDYGISSLIATYHEALWQAAQPYELASSLSAEPVIL